MQIVIRAEQPGDAPIIRQVTEAAFQSAAHSDGTEGAIVDALRAAGALSVSLVATVDDSLVGHVAFSPVTLDAVDVGWFGLGPVSVRPDRQGQGIGAALIREGLERLRALGARGCVVLGDPGYYRRFGFAQDAAIRYPGVPAEYFMALSLDGLGRGRLSRRLLGKLSANAPTFSRRRALRIASERPQVTRRTISSGRAPPARSARYRRRLRPLSAGTRRPPGTD